VARADARSDARTVGVLLAAGSGRRFDASAAGRKLEVLLDGVPVAERSLTMLAECVDAVVVAARSADSPVARFASAKRALVVVPSDAADGMGHSLAAAARFVRDAFPDAKSVVVALADMPWIRSSTIATLVETSVAEDCIAQPTHNGHAGHPVVFPARYLSELSLCAGGAGARSILRANEQNLHVVAVTDPGVVRDIDVPDDLPAGN